MIYNEEIPLSQHDILDEDDCRATRDRVMTLSNRWIQRSSTSSFFTLGAASYLDAPGDRAAYLKRAQAENPIVEEGFAWLHEKIRLFFEELLGEATFYDRRYALPGFHVFVMDGGDRRRDDAAARAHFDLQWMQVLPGFHPSGTLSFTLPVELPIGGSSMKIWHARYQDALRLAVTARKYASEHDSQEISYVRGRIVVHDGLVLHAIGGSSVNAPKGRRVTLQGHGVRTPEGWLLYW